jgi:predicted  nucleic acid-binding Zn-ribbon protein
MKFNCSYCGHLVEAEPGWVHVTCPNCQEDLFVPSPDSVAATTPSHRTRSMSSKAGWIKVRIDTVLSPRFRKMWIIIAGLSLCGMLVLYDQTRPIKDAPQTWKEFEAEERMRADKKKTAVILVRRSGYDIGKRVWGYHRDLFRPRDIYSLWPVPKNMDNMAHGQWNNWVRGEFGPPGSEYKYAADVCNQYEIKEAWSEGFKKGYLELAKPEIERFNRGRGPAF